MLFDAKLAEIERHIAYIRTECEACRSTAYPNLAERLRLLVAAIDGLLPEVATLRNELTLYRAASRPALDTWRQLFTRLRSLSREVQFLRLRELPAYLAATPHDHFMSNVFEALHREVGLSVVHPVVSLHQNTWFAVVGGISAYQLYLAPASLITDPAELSLVYHEMGHTLFRLWNPDFGQSLDLQVSRALKRKIREARSASSDPHVRQDRTAALRDWRAQARAEMEELVCDAVGTLLGGPSFVVALTLGFIAPGSNPFVHEAHAYPPLDVRMRLGCLVLRQRGLEGDVVRHLEDDWARVQSLYVSDQPRWYPWLYDDAYLSDVVEATEQYLVARGLKPYGVGSTGLRAELASGAADLIAADGAGRWAWASALADRLRRDYMPSAPSSSQSSASSSSSSASSSSA